MASTMGSVLESNEPIWIWSQVDKARFYAFTIFLSTVRSNQKAIRNPMQPPRRSNVPGLQKDPRNEILDLLALLFARYKYNKSEIAQKGLQGAHGVTATALQFSSEESSDLGTQNWTIHIAKNAGPQDFDGHKDIDVAAKLTLWYNNLTEENLIIPGPEEPIWKTIIHFWNRRTSFILNELLSIRREWANDGHTGRTDLPIPLKAYCEAHKIRAPSLTEKAIKRDWILARDILLSLDPDDSESENGVHELVQRCCFDSTDWSTVHYPKSKYRTGEQLRKAVQLLKLLKTPRLVLKGLTRFRKDNPNVRLKFKMLPAWPVSPLNEREMSDTKAIIKGLPEPPSEENLPTAVARQNRKMAIKKFKKDRDKVLNILNAMPGGFYRTFHCELQLMNKFWSHDDVHRYFGGSKLSCYLCATLLGISKYRTRGSHLTLYADCAFPFTYSNEDSSCFKAAGEILKKETQSLEDYLVKKSKEEDYDLSRCTSNTHTIPTSMISSRADIDDDDDINSSDYSNRSGEENGDDEDEEKVYANFENVDADDETDRGKQRGELEGASEGKEIRTRPALNES